MSNTTAKTQSHAPTLADKRLGELLKVWYALDDAGKQWLLDQAKTRRRADPLGEALNSGNGSYKP